VSPLEKSQPDLPISYFFYGSCNCEISYRRRVGFAVLCPSTSSRRITWSLPLWNNCMELAAPRSHLSRISTPWTLVDRAHGGAADCAAGAQRLLLQRYCGAAYRYLRGALRDEDAAFELLHEFVLRFLRGDFHRADPGSGRFRDYLKAALIHLVTDYHRELQARPRPLPADIDDRSVTQDDAVANEATFLQSWREELVNRTWVALAEAKPTYHAVLSFHVENPALSSAGAAEQLTFQLGKHFTATHVRVTLQRAREKFAELLLDEVTLSLGTCTEAELVQELSTLRMLKLCVTALERRKGR
jgi:DNA-directed RNA polymerase specialized sigma24 family protein